MFTTCIRGIRAFVRTAWWPLFWKGAAWAGAAAAVAHVGSQSLTYVAPGAIGPPQLDRITLTTSASAPPTAAPSVSATASASCCPADTRNTAGAFDAQGRLRINVARAEDFDKLPGIGKKRAESIVTLRERIGRFRHLRDLMRVRGIGYRSVQRLEPLITFDDPPKPPSD